MSTEESLYHELTAYTLELRDPEFIHQHVVDAYAVQHANAKSKPIGVVFALIGLYLHVEKGFNGRQVQLVHMQLAQRRRQWPVMELPKERGCLTVAEVVAAPPGRERKARIHEWCKSVWETCMSRRGQISELLKAEIGIS